MDVDEAGALTLGYQPVRPLDEWGLLERGESTFSLLELVAVVVEGAPEAAAESGVGTEGARLLREAQAEREAKGRARLAAEVLGKPAKAAKP